MDTFIVGKGYTRQKPIVRKHWQTYLGTALANEIATANNQPNKDYEV